MRRLATALLAMGVSPAASQEPMAVYAAGSLREALTEVAEPVAGARRCAVALTFGASGLLRERIERGETVEVFASADTDHPQRLAASRRLAATGAVHAQPACARWPSPRVDVDAREARCCRRSFAATSASVLRRRTPIRPATTPGRCSGATVRYAPVRTPRSTPRRSNSPADLDSPKPPPGRGTYAWVMEQSQADVFLTYCTNAVASQA